MVCLKKGEQKLFIRFVTAFCYCCLRDPRISLLRQAFIFSEEISCLVINFGMEICVCGLLFHVRTFTQKAKGKCSISQSLMHFGDPQIVW